MGTRMTANGVSTCQAGQEQYEKFQSGFGRKKRTLVQYDYREKASGELFSCMASTLDGCRSKRDSWLKQKGYTKQT